MEREYHRRPRPRSVKPSLCGFLALIGRLIFFNPVWTEWNQEHGNMRFMYVHFSAWHFAGSDLLWAGLAMRLFQTMQVKFGKLPIAIYRVTQHDEEHEVVKKVVIEGRHQWRSKKCCCCPLWALILLVPVIVATIIVLLVMFGLHKTEVHEGNSTTTTLERPVAVLNGLAIAALGVPAVSAMRFVVRVGKNIIFNQNVNLMKGMDNEKVSVKLGFMNEVRKEMFLLSSFIHFMEVFERRRIRVVLEITNLDRCSPRKIVSVLEAISILLSNEESPFISILGVNPEVLIQKVNFADGCFSKEDRAYSLLNRIVTLAFTVPSLCDASKSILFNSLTSHSKNSEDLNSRGNKRTAMGRTEMSPRKQYNIPLMETVAAFEVEDKEIESLVQSILISQQGKLNDYMLDDVMSMRRVISSVQVTVILMKASETELPPPEDILAWVVMANQWPCRLSWIMQCVEDSEQREEIDGTKENISSKTLWEIFSESKGELYVMSTQIGDLLEQDGDPEMFELFLKVDFIFTVKDMKTFKPATVNLDHTIRKELGQIRGTSRLNDLGWMRNVAPLPIRAIIKMNADDVCRELEKLNYPSSYADIVKKNELSGLALLFGDPDDLKSILDMSYGEWTTFRMHFLGLPSHHRLQNKTLQWTPRHLRNQLPKLPQLVPQHHASNLSLVFS